MSLRKKHPSQALLISYLTNDCTMLEQQWMDAHLACCAACLEKLELERTINELLDILPILQPADDFTDRVMDSISAAGQVTNQGSSEAPSGHKSYTNWRAEIMHAMIAFMGTYIFIASGTLHRIVNQWAGQFSFSVQETVLKSMTISYKLLDQIAALFNHLS
ncbi:hypothetical protein [Paenibacillus radicis (ex Xue et al. 2023)]|uniref:Zinc-finger domain-containing protein n=1 Tax=Paenibacillus radicis (ex Xue et al. 2023) TaxID=2972489 RepID=A0ABT1YB42_9BACL|nr:hypothetical protein [Paenibacillus radicis (ex Xue et al. 2023)]MCR8629975.1 hypothetical protein [Paenibacillus radicis (ex Xue et al. 2023)]